ncbi:alanine racemase [Fodinicurvata sediminis]|uniref:alanine racemase n=1 Tax=Fodinicurvata sediminis TaxID=1121832 RepID=UPI0003B5F714|nr:alanine racemase [Fodinicurvata sediminis]
MPLMSARQERQAPYRASEPARALLHIDLSALERNYRSLRAQAVGCEVSAVVKRDAYGLGLEAVGRTLSGAGCRSFWVADFEEGLRLRGHLPEDRRILVMEGLFARSAMEYAEAGLIPVIDQLEELEACARSASSEAPFPLVLNLDTGLARTGMPEAELRRLVPRDDLLAQVRLVLVMTTLSDFEQPANPVNAEQLARLKELAALLPASSLSAATSSFVYHDAGWHLDVARVGSALYGVRSAALANYNCAPVVALEAPVLSVREIAAGQAVSYGGPRLDHAVRAATLALGYADGLPERFSQTCRAFLGTHCLRFLGSEAMTLSTVDVSALPAGRPQRGESVQIVGPQQDINAVGHALGVNPNRVLTGFGARAQRCYYHDDNHAEGNMVMDGQQERSPLADATSAKDVITKKRGRREDHAGE